MTVDSGETVQIWFTVVNSGTSTWRGRDGYRYRGFGLWSGRTWDFCCDFPPGSADNFVASPAAPASSGVYQYGVTLNHNGIDFGPSFFVEVTVRLRGPAGLDSGAAGFDSAYAGEGSFLTLRPGQSGTFTVFFWNIGTTSWTKGTATQVDLAACLDDKVTCNAQDAAESAFNFGWPSATRYATATQNSVAPGQIGSFTWNVTVPLGATSRTYRFNGDLVLSTTGQRIHPGGYYQDVTVP